MVVLIVQLENMNKLLGNVRPKLERASANDTQRNYSKVT